MAIRDFGISPREPGRPQLVPPRKTPKWKKVLLWTGVAVLVLILVVAIGIYAALHSGPVHNYAQNVVQQKLSAALNTPVQLQNFVLHPLLGTVDLYGVVVQGANLPRQANVQAAAGPLLQVQHMHLGVSVSDLLHGKLSPTDITVDSPVVYFYVNADGQTNLPNFQSSGSNTNLFDLAIRHMAINQGQVYVNDRKNTLDADLHDLLFNSNYDASNGGQYSGVVSYSNGHLKYDTYEPIPHEMEAHFNATRSGMTLSNVKLTSGQSQVLVNATLNNYSNPKLHAKYVVILALNQIRGEMHEASIPGGVVLVNGTADYASVPGQPPLESASMQGSIHSRVLQVRTPSLNTDIRNVDGSYALAHGNVDVHDLTASLVGWQSAGECVGTEHHGRTAGTRGGGGARYLACRSEACGEFHGTEAGGDHGRSERLDRRRLDGQREERCAARGRDGCGKTVVDASEQCRAAECGDSCALQRQDAGSRVG